MPLKLLGTLQRVSQKECLAVIYSVQKFTIITDHRNLIWLNNLEQPRGVLARWSTFLSQFDYGLVYRPVKDNILAEALSRASPDNHEIVEISEISAVTNRRNYR